jgi:hypothetical protein
MPAYKVCWLLGPSTSNTSALLSFLFSARERGDDRQWQRPPSALIDLVNIVVDPLSRVFARTSQQHNYDATSLPTIVVVVSWPPSLPHIVACDLMTTTRQPHPSFLPHHNNKEATPSFCNWLSFLFNLPLSTTLLIAAHAAQQPHDNNAHHRALLPMASLMSLSHPPPLAFFTLPLQSLDARLYIARCINLAHHNQLIVLFNRGWSSLSPCPPPGGFLDAGMGTFMLSFESNWC